MVGVVGEVGEVGEVDGSHLRAIRAFSRMIAPAAAPPATRQAAATSTWARLLRLPAMRPIMIEIETMTAAQTLSSGSRGGVAMSTPSLEDYH